MWKSNGSAKENCTGRSAICTVSGSLGLHKFTSHRHQATTRRRAGCPREEAPRHTPALRTQIERDHGAAARLGTSKRKQKSVPVCGGSKGNYFSIEY
jgi:hypothetical protein